MIILGLGSNLSSSFGDRFKNIDLSISHLESRGIILVKKSSYYETPSYPDLSLPKFINVVIIVSSTYSLKDLISIIIDIEKKMERIRKKKNDPRTCDIDIIDFNNKVLEFEFQNLSYTIPHKKCIYRNFVLFPLLEVLPSWIHPKLNKSINELTINLSDNEKKSILKINKC